MYQIRADNEVIYDPRLEDYKVFNPKVSFEVNKTGSLSFKIYNTHPYYSMLKKSKTILSVLDDGKIIFKGRITEDTRDFNNGKQVDCEGLLAFLNDSMLRPFEFQGTPEELFIMIIENHNSQVQEFQKFKIGRITVVDHNDYINRSSTKHLKSWEVIKTRLLDTLGGYIQIRYEADGMYIDYLQDFVSEDGFKFVSTQSIEFGKNLLDVKQKVKAPVATAMIPLGAKLEANSEARLTIESIENQEDGDIVKIGDTIYSKSGVAQYGFIYAKIEDTTWEDVTKPENLYRKAKEELLGTKIKLSETIELSAIDMQKLGYKISNFRYCEYIKVFSKPHDIDELYLLSKLSFELDKPNNTKITLGETKLSLTDKNISNDRNLVDSIEKINNTFKNYVLNEEMTEIREQILENTTAIVQDSQNIVFKALEQYVSTGNFEEYKEIIATQFVQTANDFTFLFDNAISKINTLDGDTKAQFQEWQKYIRFVDGNIVLGKVGNEITLSLENDILYFLQNNNRVAYLSNNKLYVTDGEFINSLIVGLFGFKPRKNGSLSFGKIKK